MTRHGFKTKGKEMMQRSVERREEKEKRKRIRDRN